MGGVLFVSKKDKFVPSTNDGIITGYSPRNTIYSGYDYHRVGVTNCVVRTNKRRVLFSILNLGKRLKRRRR